MSGATKIAAGTVVQRGREPLFMRLDDDLLSLDPSAGLCYSLNRPGARVWELIETPTTVGAVCDRLECEYEVEQETCLEQVIELLGDLQAVGLVEITGVAE